jgi:hypothetical protein
MIEFKKDVEKILPYHRQLYRNFWDTDSDSLTEWRGVAFQLPGAYEGKVVALPEFVGVYEVLFKNVISELDTGSFWIVNHDDDDGKWFPNNEDNLIPLRSLFKFNKVPNTFKGGLTFTKDDLLKYCRDLISYPSAVFNEEGRYYKSLDISHGTLPFIMKIYGRFSVDLQSTDENLLRKIVKENSSSPFIVREFTGTSL